MSLCLHQLYQTSVWYNSLTTLRLFFLIPCNLLPLPIHASIHQLSSASLQSLDVRKHILRGGISKSACKTEETGQPEQQSSWILGHYMGKERVVLLEGFLCAMSAADYCKGVHLQIASKFGICLSISQAWISSVPVFIRLRIYLTSFPILEWMAICTVRHTICTLSLSNQMF